MKFVRQHLKLNRDKQKAHQDNFLLKEKLV